MSLIRARNTGMTAGIEGLWSGQHTRDFPDLVPEQHFKLMPWDSGKGTTHRDKKKINLMKHFGEIGAHYVDLQGGVDGSPHRQRAAQLARVRPGDTVHMYSDLSGGCHWQGVVLSGYETPTASQKSIELDMADAPRDTRSHLAHLRPGDPLGLDIRFLRRCSIAWDLPTALTPRRRRHLVQQGQGTVISLRTPY